MGQSNYKPLPTLTGDISRRERITYAAISGFATGTICAFVASFINTWLYPDLPLYIAWPHVFVLWLVLAGTGTMLAGLAANQPDGWAGIVQAAFGMAVIGQLVALAPAITLNTFIFYLVIMLGLSIPMTAIFSPVAYLFLWLARRFVELRNVKDPQGWKVLSVNILVIILLGSLPGLYPKFDERAEKAVRMIHALLQEARQVVAADALPTALIGTEGFAEHKDQAYTLSQVPSANSTTGLDVTAHYADGYTILCTVVLYPGSQPYIDTCEGRLP